VPALDLDAQDALDAVDELEQDTLVPNARLTGVGLVTVRPDGSAMTAATVPT